MSDLTKEQFNDILEFMRRGPDLSPADTKEILISDFDYFVRSRATLREWQERFSQIRVREWEKVPVEQRQAMMEEANDRVRNSRRIETMQKIEEVDAACSALLCLMGSLNYDGLDAIHLQIRNAVATHKGMMTSLKGGSLPYPAKTVEQILEYPYTPDGESA